MENNMDIFDTLPENTTLEYIYKSRAEYITKMLYHYNGRNISVEFKDDVLTITFEPINGKTSIKNDSWKYKVESNNTIKLVNNVFETTTNISVYVENMHTDENIYIYAHCDVNDIDDFSTAFLHILVHVDGNIAHTSMANNVAFMIRHEYERYKYEI